jgi:hypothetical protein
VADLVVEAHREPTAFRDFCGVFHALCRAPLTAELLFELRNVYAARNEHLKIPLPAVEQIHGIETDTGGGEAD